MEDQPNGDVDGAKVPEHVQEEPNGHVVDLVHEHTNGESKKTLPFELDDCMLMRNLSHEKTQQWKSLPQAQLQGPKRSKKNPRPQSAPKSNSLELIHEEMTEHVISPEAPSTSPLVPHEDDVINNKDSSFPTSSDAQNDGEHHHDRQDHHQKPKMQGKSFHLSCKSSCCRRKDRGTKDSKQERPRKESFMKKIVGGNRHSRASIVSWHSEKGMKKSISKWKFWITEKIANFREPKEREPPPDWHKMLRAAEVANGFSARQWRCNLRLSDVLLLESEEKKVEQATKWAKFDLFFGSFVVINGLMIGVQADEGIDFTELRWRQIENAFLVVFIVELVLRTFFMGIRTMLKDVWTYFDLAIIGISAIDNVLLSPMQGQFVVFRRLNSENATLAGSAESEVAAEEEGSNLSGLTALRAIRLFRLARLIRLFRLMKELWLLVMGLYLSLRTLFWTLLMLTICLYCFGIVMVELVGKDDISFANQPEIKAKFGSVVQAMWTLLKMTTFDDWSGGIHEVNKKLITFIVLSLFVCICGLGLLNLIVGIMCNSAMIVSTQDDEVAALQTRVTCHKAAISLRRKLNDEAPPDHKFTFLEIAEIIKADKILRKELKEGNISPLALHNAWEAVDHFAPRHCMTCDELVEAVLWLGADIRTRFFDLLELECILRRFMSELKEVEKHCATGVLHLYGSIQTSLPWADKADQKSKKALADMQIKVEQYSQWLEMTGHHPEEPIVSSKTMQAKTAKTKKSQTMKEDSQNSGDEDDNFHDKAERTFGRFDGFFGIFLIINSVLIGVQVDDPKADTEHSLLWWAIDILFQGIFSVELWFRIFLFHQVHNERDTESYLYLFPKPKPRKEWGHCLVHGWLKFQYDPFGLFDVVIVLICLLDNLIFYWVLTDLDASLVSVVRFIRLLKVARVARSFKLTNELFLLVKGVSLAMRAVFWSVSFLIITVYVGGIVICETVGKPAREEGINPEMVRKYGTVDGGMWILLQLSSFDGWAETLEELADLGYTKTIPWLLGLIAFNGLGIMNLTVGVMCQSAMAVTKSLKEADRKQHLKALKESLSSIRQRFADVSSGGGKCITRAMLDESLQEGPLVAAFAKAQLQPSEVWSMFDRLSMISSTNLEKDQVDINEFIMALMRFGQPINYMDLAAVKCQMAMAEDHFDLVIARTCHLVAELATAQKLLLDPVVPKKQHISKVIESWRPEAETHFTKYMKQLHHFREMLAEQVKVKVQLPTTLYERTEQEDDHLHDICGTCPLGKHLADFSADPVPEGPAPVLEGLPDAGIKLDEVKADHDADVDPMLVPP